jgi:hypothetical protein
VTALLKAPVPVTVATKSCVVLAVSVVVAGATVTAEIVEGTTTVAVAVPFLLASWELVAVIV